MAIPETKFVWMNGEFVKWKDATIHILSHVIHYGTGVFEGIRCYETDKGPAVFRLDEHVERLINSSKVYNFEFKYSHDEVKEAILETIRINELKSCYIRPLVYMGFNGLAVNPKGCPTDFAISVWPWGAYLGEDSLEKGIRAVISPWQKFNSNMMPTMAKACGQYLNSNLAVSDANKNGYDEAILLNSKGTVAEGSGENIFLVEKGKIITNSSDSSILLGITRDSVIEISRDLGYEVIEREISVSDLFFADEAFFTGTATEIAPIREINERVIGVGKRGEITKIIQDKFFEAIFARDEKYEKWLTFV